MEKSVVNGRVVSGSTLERTYKNFNLRRALVSLHELSSRLGEAVEGPTSYPTSEGGGRGPGDEGGGGGRPNNGGTTFETLDPNVVIILVVLLFALICAAFLNSIMRCVMRRSNRARDSPEESQTVQGLDAKALAILPVHSYRGAQFEKLNDGSPVECPICLSDFVENEKVRLLPRCNHVFHIDCIDTWLLSHVSCPVCRDGVTDDPKLESSAIIVVEEQSDSPDNSTPGQSNIRAELRRETGTSSSSSYPVQSSSSLSGNGNGSSSGQGVESASGRRGRGIRASFSSMFAAENFMVLFTAANLGPVSRGHGSSAATASSSASTNSLP